MNIHFRKFIKFSKFNFASLPAGAVRPKKGQIVNYEYRVKKMPDFTKVLPGDQVKLNLRRARVPTKISEFYPPQLDVLNFKKMSGNEILLNMTNCEYFNKIELISSLLELHKRVNLEENMEFRNYEWSRHQYVYKTVQRLVKEIGGMNIRHTLITCGICNKFKVHDSVIWKRLEGNILRMIHKLNSRQIAYVLDLFDRKNIGGEELFAKLTTILPMHVDFLSLKEFTRVFEVCLNKNLGTDRLYHIFFLKKLERNAHKMDFELYIRNLKNLGRKRFDLDNIFYMNYMLPPLFGFEYSISKAIAMSETLHFLKQNCPAIDFSRHIEVIDNLIKEFSAARKEGQDVKDVRLRIKPDLKIVPKEDQVNENIDIQAMEQELRAKMKDKLDNMEEFKGDEEGGVHLGKLKKLVKEDENEAEENQESNERKRMTKKQEKKLKIQERRQKKSEKLAEKKEAKKEKLEEASESTKEGETVEVSHKGPRRRHVRGMPTNAPDLDTDVKATKEHGFKADTIVKKNENMRKHNKPLEEENKNL